jgi:hypothetical protein
MAEAPFRIAPTFTATRPHGGKYLKYVAFLGFQDNPDRAPTIAQCLHGGYGWLEVKCHRCETSASLPLEAIRRPRDNCRCREALRPIHRATPSGLMMQLTR